jgi:dipeptidyl aminopeptidase/acylaminoacyl peptidase
MRLSCLFYYLVHPKTSSMRNIFILSLLFVSFNVSAQKKPLDHTVYDSWQSIGEKMISDDGKIVVYTITPQEGDALLVIQQTNGKKIMEIARGYNAKISPDGQFVVFKIKPSFQQTRDARIKKKKPDEMPKDSLAIVTVADASIQKIPRVKSFKMPEDESSWLAWLNEKGENDKKRDEEEGTTLCLRNLNISVIDSFQKVSEYMFDKKGNNLAVEITKNKKDSVLRSAIVWMKLKEIKFDTLLKNFADARGYSFDEEGKQLAFVATNDTGKIEQKDYMLYKFDPNGTWAILNSKSKGIPAKWRVNENANLLFSKTGKRLFFGTSPSLPAKDTSLPEFERSNVDVWHYNDDDLQPAQLKSLETDLKKSYLARFNLENFTAIQLGNENFERVQQTLEGDGAVFYAVTDSGKRVARQWQGFSSSDVYAINPENGQTSLIRKDLKGSMFPSYTGKYLLMYDEIKKGYFVCNSSTKQTYAVAKDIPYPLYDEENDVPDDPNAYGIVKWMEDDKYVLVYDKYDVWKVDPTGKEKSVAMTTGRKDKTQYRYINVDIDNKFIKPKDDLFFRVYNEQSKKSGFAALEANISSKAIWIFSDSANYSSFLKAKTNNEFVISKETSKESNLYSLSHYMDGTFVGLLTNKNLVQLSNLNPQQSQYNWLTAELFKWKAYTGKETEGILYKPEDFDPKKKYPMIVYFYERNNQTLYNYLAPSPTPSRLNIPFFVSRGYIVFVPDIWYKTGKPGQSAYDYILSGTRAVVKLGFVDSTKIGLQGQSWGGYQTAHLITRTNLYAAAWAGAPVANMFSAYGGIRWESGLNRQFQYEHTQSRIGATIWDRPDLYIENSPLFHLKKVKTPLVIMANDKDGAVPWYQGIELFTAMRRLDKKAWMLNYNDEAHNLVERRNRKDIQIREQQFFDWLLKGEKPPTWIINGVPALMKGRTWGL